MIWSLNPDLIPEVVRSVGSRDEMRSFCRGCLPHELLPPQSSMPPLALTDPPAFWEQVKRGSGVKGCFVCMVQGLRGLRKGVNFLAVEVKGVGFQVF